ncbi:MAG: hypothetical protein HY349_08145 [Nitrospirae bacterium]|nr:hypothetical protein [Nitrospirota bacterium]
MTHDNTKKPKSRQIKRQDLQVAKATRYASKGSRISSKGNPETGGSVHEVRERNGEYGPPQDPPEEESTKPIDSTRFLETAKGTLSYAKISERLAVALTGLLTEIVQIPPDRIAITPERREAYHG